jgi:hypothetical protein
MVETISPVVHGGRGARYRLSVLLHTLGAVLAASAFGAVLGGAGAVLWAPWGRWGLVALAVVAAAYALREAAGVPVPIPDRARQVPDWWRTFYSPGTAAFLYGMGLGVGFLTFLSYGTFVAVAAAAVASGSPLAGAALCAPFGLARGLSIVVANGTLGSRGPGTAVGTLEELATTRLPRAANALALAGVTVSAAAAAALSA